MLNHKLSTIVLSIGVAVFCIGVLCTQASPRQKDPSQVRFRAVEKEVGLINTHRNGVSQEKHMIETMGSGAAFIDFNNDGLLDIFVVGGVPTDIGRLFKNDGGRRFVEVTKSGIMPSIHGMGVAVADYDNDGFQDIYITGYPRNYLYQNQGDGTFKDVSAQAGVAAAGWSTSAAFFDADNDGVLDLYVTRYVEYNPKLEPYCGLKEVGWRSYCQPDIFAGTTNILFLNMRNGRFREATQESGVLGSAGKGLGVVVADYNNDGLQDLFVTNDRFQNFLFTNKGNARFEETGLYAGIALNANGWARAGMGVDAGDIDNDGYVDFLTTNFEDEGAILFHNSRDGTFKDIAESSRILSGTLRVVGFGAKLADFDSDGSLDVMTVNGHVIDNVTRYRPKALYRQPKLLFVNEQERRFALPVNVFPNVPNTVGRGLAVGDFDNDGRVDALVTNNGGETELLHNESSPQQRWLVMQLVGRVSNRDAIGARLEIRSGSIHQFRSVTSSGSYLSASDRRVHVGLGSRKGADEVTIYWPSGLVQRVANLVADHLYRIVEGEPKVVQREVQEYIESKYPDR